MKVALTHNLRRTAEEAEAEFDTPETIAALCRAVAEAGHDAVPVEVSGPIETWTARLRELQPAVVLNSAEGLRGEARTALVPAVLESLGLRFTGSGARVQVLTQDKHLTKLCVAAAGVPVIPGGLVRTGHGAPALPPGPWFVKPNFEGSSKGISEQSVVAERGGLEAALAAGLALYPEGILVEQFIPGTDVTVGFVEGQDPEILTPCSYEIAAAWMNRYRIYDYRLKNVAPDEVVQPVCPARVPPEIRQVVARHAQSAVKALGLRGLARLDFRVRDDGEVFFVEANATPSLEPGSSIFVAARVAGRSYGEVIAHLISHAAA